MYARSQRKIPTLLEGSSVDGLGSAKHEILNQVQDDEKHRPYALHP